ncbi:MAG: ATP-binding protein [Bacteroidales bacterium]|nr:ATP-binding protein [Bacteroidales bacterium]
MKINPFLLSGYISHEYFCDRELETNRLINAIENQRNITLISSRRMGKTGLIMHVFDYISKNSSYVPIYFDIMGTTGFGEFAEVFSNALLQTISKTESAWKGFLRKLSALRPSLGFDSLTGEPRISLDIRNEQELDLTLDLVFSLIAQKKKFFVFAIDEFQQIASYPEKNVEARLRAYVQKANNISFIFSGSRKHMLADMFSQPSRPFFNSTEMMFLEVIDRSAYFAFIRAHFSERGKTIDEEALNRIAQYTGLHTFYVQFLANRLFSSFKKTGVREVDQSIQTILHENEPIYANYINLLTITQYKTLRAIALEGVVENPTSGNFLARYRLGAASTVSQAVSSLTGKEFIHNDAGRLSVQDKFFAQWIRSR